MVPIFAMRNHLSVYIHYKNKHGTDQSRRKEVIPSRLILGSLGLHIRQGWLARLTQTIGSWPTEYRVSVKFVYIDNSPLRSSWYLPVSGRLNGAEIPAGKCRKRTSPRLLHSGVVCTFINMWSLVFFGIYVSLELAIISLDASSSQFKQLSKCKKFLWQTSTLQKHTC